MTLQPLAVQRFSRGSPESAWTLCWPRTTRAVSDTSRELPPNTRRGNSNGRGLPVKDARQQVDDTRMPRRGRALFDRVGELAFHRAAPRRISFVEASYVGHVDRKDRLGGTVRLEMVREGPKNQSRVVRRRDRDARELLQGGLEISPVLDDREPIAAVLERAVDEPAGQRIVRRKHAGAAADIDDGRSLSEAHEEADLSIIRSDKLHGDTVLERTCSEVK
ncbi:hypothetical protein IC762_01820 [Bradyrhizobium genosp. L]|nr:hypothetical protein IC762_01820 [Bradyrhizobium genosp. L]